MNLILIDIVLLGQKYRAPTTPVKSAANESPSSSPVESNYYSLESSIKTESDKRIKKK